MWNEQKCPPSIIWSKDVCAIQASPKREVKIWQAENWPCCLQVQYPSYVFFSENQSPTSPYKTIPTRPHPFLTIFKVTKITFLAIESLTLPESHREGEHCPRTLLSFKQGSFLEVKSHPSNSSLLLAGCEYELNALLGFLRFDPVHLAVSLYWTGPDSFFYPFSVNQG